MKCNVCNNELKNDNIPRYLVIKVEEDKYIFYIC